MYKGLNSTGTLIQRTATEVPQNRSHATGTGRLDRNGSSTTMVAMEATIFTGWIYDHLRPQDQQVNVAHPLMLRALCTLGIRDARA